MNGDVSYYRLIEMYNKARENAGIVPYPSSQIRDLTVLQLVGDMQMVVAVDSDGAIGEKESDVVKVTGYECGRFGARVPLMEILASGAVPVAAFDALAVEMEPYGRSIIKGVRDELSSIGLPDTFPLSGSTEDNIPTVQTGIGVVIIGIVSKHDFKPGTSMPGDRVLCIGIPKSGPNDHISLEDPDIADSKTVAQLRNIDGVHDILPVGSKGVLYEANELARIAGLTFQKQDSVIDMVKSAGPSTCFLVSTNETARDILQEKTDKPVNLIGSLVPYDEKRDRNTFDRSGNI
jgi:hypothetical protein